MGRGVRLLDGGRPEVQDYPLRFSIDWPYMLGPFVRVVGSSDLLDQTFIIWAKTREDLPLPGANDVSPLHLMTRALLRDRFAMQVSWKDEMLGVIIGFDHVLSQRFRTVRTWRWPHGRSARVRSPSLTCDNCRAYDATNVAARFPRAGDEAYGEAGR